jgi:hypothetical protein
MSDGKTITTEKALAMAREAAKANIKAIQKKQMVMHKKYHGSAKNPLYFVWPTPVQALSDPVPRTESTQCMDLKMGKSETAEAFVPQVAVKSAIEKNHGCKYFDRVDAPYLEPDAPKTTENWVSIYKNCFVDPNGSVPIDEATNKVAGLSIPKGINAPPMYAWKRTACAEVKPAAPVVCGIDGCTEPVYQVEDSYSLPDADVDVSVAPVEAAAPALVAKEDPKVRPYFYAWGAADAHQEETSEIASNFRPHQNPEVGPFRFDALHVFRRAVPVLTFGFWCFVPFLCLCAAEAGAVSEGACHQHRPL